MGTRSLNPDGSDEGERGSGVRAGPWPVASTAGSPAILGNRPEDRRFCVPALRRVCPCQRWACALDADVRVVRSATHHSLRRVIRGGWFVSESFASRANYREWCNSDNPDYVAVWGRSIDAAIGATDVLRIREIQALAAFGRWLTSSGARSTVRALSWGHSSAGRALAWHARGRRFDPVWLHQIRSGPTAIERRMHSVPIV